MKSIEYELTIWEGDYGVPSVDIDSLIIITYLKFSKVQCSIKYGSNPYSTPTLTVKNNSTIKKIVGFDNIWIYFQCYMPEIDDLLPPSQKWVPYAYFTYIKKMLFPGLQYTMWIDNQNYIDVTRKWFRNSMLIPFNFVYPYYKRNTITEYIKSLIPEEDLHSYSYLLTEDAKKCISDLSTKLGDKNYLLGEHPSTLDAIVYGYISPLLNAPLPSSQLQSFLKEQDNLVKYFKRITTTLYPHITVEYKYVAKLQQEDDVQEFKSSPRAVAAAAFCAATAMICYGMINGIFKIPDAHVLF